MDLRDRVRHRVRKKKEAEDQPKFIKVRPSHSHHRLRQRVRKKEDPEFWILVKRWNKKLKISWKSGKIGQKKSNILRKDCKLKKRKKLKIAEGNSMALLHNF